VDNRELRIEIFEPWYVGARTARPSLLTSTWWRWAANSGSPPSRRTPLCASPSYARDRLHTRSTPISASWPFPSGRDGTTLVVELPENESLLPPGPWLVFLVAQSVDPDVGPEDVPSEGKWLKIAPHALLRMLAETLRGSRDETSPARRSIRSSPSSWNGSAAWTACTMVGVGELPHGSSRERKPVMLGGDSDDRQQWWRAGRHTGRRTLRSHRRPAGPGPFIRLV
jgi:hypothetical protein